VIDAATDRFPPIPDAEMTEAQRDAAAELSSGPRGAVVGPFIAALRSPEFMRHLQRLGEYLRYRSAIGPRLTEFAILLVARRWTQQFEWVMHVPLAIRQGLSQATIDAIAAGERPGQMTDAERAVYEFVAELDAAQAVTDETFANAELALGEAGIVDLLGIIGYYSTLAMILNVAQAPLPDGFEPALEPQRR
jgi:4-carboxymuconolactone decarboxylase